VSTFVVGDVHGRRAQLRALVSMIPRDESRDTLVLVGDLVDRGTDIPGTIEDVVALKLACPDGVVSLRGNHEQMLLDYVEGAATIWLHAAIGSEATIEQYTGEPVRVRSERDLRLLRRRFSESVPTEHLDFFRSTPLYHEDEFAIYVHAGLDAGKHPRDTDPAHLLWSRDPDFYKSYAGKPCVFGHTPTPLLPLRGRLGHHGIYMYNSAVGIDTGYSDSSPLSCLQLPELNLYQSYADGRTATHQLSSFVPEPLRAVQRRYAAQPGAAIAGV
jgi:serine/threonine protein phosphatase 1